MSKNILIVDDSPAIRDMIKKTVDGQPLFNKCYEAKDGVEALNILLNNKIDFVICDIMMPNMDGFKFLSMLRGNEDFNNIAVIMLTSKGDTASKIKGLNIGANDYVTKPFEPAELLARIKVLLRMQELQEELTRKNVQLNEINKELNILANTDGLTKIYNHRYFHENLSMEIQRAIRYKIPLSCVMIDIDNFKEVNDIYGHQQGDTTLRELAKTLKNGLRKHDFLARYGGEEFIVYLPHIDKENAYRYAERTRKKVEAFNFTIQSGSSKLAESLKITISLGVATFPDENLKGKDDLLRGADMALYEAKRNGKNCVKVFS